MVVGQEKEVVKLQHYSVYCAQFYETTRSCGVEWFFGGSRRQNNLSNAGDYFDTVYDENKHNTSGISFYLF